MAATTLFPRSWWMAASALGLLLGCAGPLAPAASTAPLAAPAPTRITQAPGLRAHLQECRPLRYTSLAERELDRPEFVRSASGMERFGNGFAILQDDLNSVGVVQESGETRYLDLPRGGSEPRRFEHTRGNLHLKTDYEAAFVLEVDGRQLLFAFGSGTLAPRERIAIVSSSGEARRVEASAFYATLRAARDFSGGSLNLEGAELYGEWLLLVQRGDPERGVANAVAGLRLREFLEWTEGVRRAPPRVAWVRRYDLGGDPASFGFSGLTANGDGRLVFTASAELGHGGQQRGTIVGSRLGLLEGPTGFWAPIVDAEGYPATLKAEGVVADPTDARRYLVTTDPDNSEEPALLCTIELSGDWPAATTPNSDTHGIEP